MKSKNVVLLKAFLKSTSQYNAYKYSKDKKKKGTIVGNTIGMSVLFLCLMAYCILMCVGYGKIGLTNAIPSMCSLIISAISFIFTLIKVNGYLFEFKEYDMIISLPVEIKDVVGDKFLYMYIKALPWYLSISIAMLIGYGIYGTPKFIVYPVWVISSFLIPIIPMLLATFLGFIIAKIGAGFKKKKIIQTVLILLLTISAVFSRFFIEAMFKNGKTEETLNSMADFTNGIDTWYLPSRWFTEAVNQCKFGSFLVLIGVSIVLFEVVFMVISKSYRKINSQLKSHAAKKSYKMTNQKQKNVISSIAYKEFKRLLGSTTYLTNIGFGEIMTFILGVAALIVGADKLIASITEGAPVTKEMILPAIPFIVYFMIGMVASTCCSFSLEGKNYWILKSLPIKKMDIVKGKILFNLLLTVPFSVFATLCLCISAKAGVLLTIIFTITSISLCIFSSVFGAVCGIKFMKLDWENEVEVIKQGSAVTIYLLPNMFITMGLIAGVIALGFKVSTIPIILIITVVVWLLSVISYFRVKKLSERL